MRSVRIADARSCRSIDRVDDTRIARAGARVTIASLCEIDRSRSHADDRDMRFQ
jgi:hypothetical protein